MERNNRKKMLYVSEDGGNPDTAPFVHTINVARLFAKIGYEVSLVLEGGNIPSIDKCGAKINFYNTGFEMGDGFWRRIQSLTEKLTGKMLIDKIKAVTKNDLPDVVLLYGSGPDRWLRRYCTKHHITYLVEVTDWFEGKDRNHWYTRLFFQPLYDNRLKNLPRTTDGIIVLSDWLKEYYGNTNCICIPPIFDDGVLKKYRGDETTSMSISGEFLKIVYAGQIGRKDALHSFIDALLRINTCGIKIKFEIAGITQTEFSKEFGDLNWSQMGVSVHGRVKHDEVLKMVANSHFSILLLHDRLSARAGFATKVAESMLCGVPVIATRVGGTDTVIEDGVNGILLSDNEVDTIEEKLRELLLLSNDDLMSMRENVGKFADDFFNIDAYSNLLVEFIEKASEKKKN